MKSRLETLQESIADKLRRAQALRGARVILEKPTSLEGKIEEKIFAKLGLNIIVKFPQPTLGSPSANPPSFPVVLVKVRVVENIPTNRLGISAAKAAEEALRELCLWLPNVEGIGETLKMRTDYPFYPLGGSATSNAVELSFTTSMSL